MLAHLIALPFFGDGDEELPETAAVWVPGTLGVPLDQIED